MKRYLAVVAVLSVAQFAFAQLPNVKVPGTNQRVTSQRQSSGTPSLTGVTGTCKNGATRDIVLKVARLLDLAEYKRRQAAPGVKVTLKNFGRDRRYPIVNRFRDTGGPLPQPDRALLRAQGASKNDTFDT